MRILREGAEVDSLKDTTQVEVVQGRERRLADAGAICGRGISDLRIHAHRLATLDLVEIDHLGATQHAQMNGLACLFLQFAQMRLGKGSKLIARPAARSEMK